MTYIIKNIYTCYSSQSIFTRFLGTVILAFILLIGGSGSAWAFTDFEINLVTSSAPALPDGVTQISYPQYGVNYRSGDSHGTSWYAIQFAVDGPVKITLGGCEFAKNDYQWEEDMRYFFGRAKKAVGILPPKVYIKKLWKMRSLYIV